MPIIDTATTQSALFLGRRDCQFTAQLLHKLSELRFKIVFVESSSRNEPLPDKVFEWHGDFIICFRSLYILPKVVLDNARCGAINFHPAPPEYPGSGCTNFAIYDGAQKYGVTAHIMNEFVDNGPILEVRRFPVHSEENLPSLLERTHSALFELCSDFIDGLSNFGPSYLEQKAKEAGDESWSGRARTISELDALQKIDPCIERGELERIIRATRIGDYGPTLELFGYRFKLEK